MMRKTNIVLFAVLLLICVTQQQNDTVCPDGWEPFSLIGKCYLFGWLKVNWFTAVSMCNAFGGNLLETKTENELDIIVKRMIATNIKEVWTGGNDILSDNAWRWLSTGGVLGPFRPWYHPNPSNSEGVEHCMEIRAAGGYRWNDIDCDVKNMFVCEKSPA